MEWFWRFYESGYIKKSIYKYSAIWDEIKCCFKGN